MLFTDESKFCLDAHEDARLYGVSIIMNADESAAYLNMTRVVMALLLFKREFLATGV